MRTEWTRLSIAILLVCSGLTASHAGEGHRTLVCPLATMTTIAGSLDGRGDSRGSVRPNEFVVGVRTDSIHSCPCCDAVAGQCPKCCPDPDSK